MIKLGNTDIGKLYLGNTEIEKAYLGEDLIYEVGGGPTPPTPKEYVDVYSRIFPVNGLVNERKNFFLYAKETLPIGTSIHLAMTFTSMDSTATSLDFRDAAAAAADIVIPMPQMSFDVEFVTTVAATDTFYLYFDKSVSNVQIDLSSIRFEKIV